MLGDEPKMAVALRGGCLGRLARHRRELRRHDDCRRGMARGDGGGNALLVVGTVGGERGHGSRHLIEQGADLGTVVHLLRGQHSCDDLPGVGVQADVQLAPGPARLGAVRLNQPLAGAAKLQAGAVHQQVHGLAVTARPRAWHCQRLRPAAQGRVVRHGQGDPSLPFHALPRAEPLAAPPEQADDGADQALCLAQGQAARPEASVRSGFARGEYQGYPPGLVRGSARQASMASSVNQTVRLPRWRKLASYARQLRSSAPSEFLSLCLCLGMWRRWSWFSLNGKVGIRGQIRAQPPTPRRFQAPLGGSMQQGHGPARVRRCGLVRIVSDSRDLGGCLSVGRLKLQGDGMGAAA